MKRRTFLTGIAAGSIASAGSVTARTAASSDVVHVKRPYDDPISNEHLNDLRADVADEVGRETRFTSKPEVEFESNGEVVSVVLSTAEDGTVQQDVGIAHRKRDVKKAHREGAERARELERASGQSAGTNDVTTESSWYTVEDSTVSEYSDPEGDLECIYKFLQNDNERDYFVFEQRFATMPGVQEYDSNYEANGGEVNHYWNSNYSELRDWEPFDGTDGNVSETLTVSTTDVSYSYSYSTTETTVTDRTSTRNDNAQFEVDYYETSKTSTSGFDPCSMGYNFDSAYGATYLSVVNTAEFEKANCWGCDPVELKVNWAW